MPEPIIFLILLVILPALLLWWFLKRRHRSKVDLVLHSLFMGFFVVFLFLWGQYPFAGYYLRYVLLAALILAFVWRFKNVKQLPSFKKGKILHYVLLGVFGICSLLFGTLTVVALQAYGIDKPSLELSFPLKGGTYYIGSGGSNAVLNLHYKPSTPGQWYGIDVNRLNALGFSADAFIPSNLEDHFIFGETVYSPCSGIVVKSQDGVEDNVPFEFGTKEPLGNHVIIEHEGFKIYFLHFKHGSVIVQAGDTVQVGQPIGRVGNSGFSTEPHLHMHAARPSEDDSTVSAGVPIRFGGRFLVRNDLFTNE